MGFVDDDEIPMHLTKAGEDIGTFGQIQRCDDLPLFEPLVDTELIADIAAFQNEKPLVELLLDLSLPLEGEVRGADDEDPLGEPAKLELPHEQPRHDRLACAGVVGEQEAHARQLEEVVVNGFELVRERVDPRDRETEVRIELVGNTESVSLKAEPEHVAVPVVGQYSIRYGKAGQILARERDPTKLFRLESDQADHPGVGAVRANRLPPHGLAEKRAGQNLTLVDGDSGVQWADLFNLSATLWATGADTSLKRFLPTALAAAVRLTSFASVITLLAHAAMRLRLWRLNPT